MGKSAITQAPYDSHGNLCHYPAGVAETRLIEKFLDTFTLDGKYGSVWYWTGEDGRKWPMFDTHFQELVKAITLAQGRTPRAVWTIRKMGQNYGVQFVREATA
ncbi:hypothetical protein [Nonomuraea sp. LPB2021202275-12-8]|uniref:hypothetical protein n=1 Tax=Nonomuraea sp. LPB2021202275-12-8 TaxID=3120159 RepID=UPI00300C0DF9